MSNLNVHVEDVSPVVKRVRIDVPAERVSAVTDRVFRRLGQTVRLRGYRPGHVPRRVLEKHFADQVKNDVARELVSDTFEEALGSTSLLPVAAPTVEPAEVKPGEAYHYTARVEVKPEITLQSYKGLEITAPKGEVTDEDVNKRLEEMREGATTLVPEETRDVLEMGDVAVVDYTVEFEGEDPPGGSKREGAHVRVEAGLFLEGHGEKLAGLKIGEERAFEETLDGEEVPPEIRGKVGKVVAKLTGIKRREMPVLDDEFAKDVGGVDTLDELRAKVRGEMEKSVAEEAKEARRRALLQKLIDANPVEIPPALVDRMLEENTRRLMEAFRQRGLQLPPETAQSFREAGQQQAEFDVRSMLLLDAVATAENIEVTDEDYEAHLATRAEEIGIPVEQLKGLYGARSSMRERLSGTIRSDKALAIIESAAQITTE